MPLCCTPGRNGTCIPMTSTTPRWCIFSDAPTKFLYVSFVLGFQDDPDKTLREIAVYLDTEFAEDAPPGREYNSLSDVSKPGHMLLIGRTAPIERMGTRQTFSEVMTF